MRSTMAAVAALFSLVGFVGRGLWDGAAVQAQGGGRGGNMPIGNGDVNGDGVLDISDPVYLLESLFRGGSEPVPIECPPPTGETLPASGETLCFDTAGSQIPCDSEEWPGQEGFYQPGCPTEGRFLDHGDGTVTDTCTGLMWQRETAPGTYTWQRALQYSVNEVDLPGTGWRLPDFRELQSLVHKGYPGSYIDPAFDVQPSNYWTSASLIFERSYAVVVSFEDTAISAEKKTESFYVRAVRTIQPGE